jgi:hypothetical protein
MGEEGGEKEKPGESTWVGKFQQATPTSRKTFDLVFLAQIGIARRVWLATFDIKHSRDSN